MKRAAGRGVQFVLAAAVAISLASTLLAADSKHAAAPPAGAMPGQAEDQVQHGPGGPPPRVAAPVPFVSTDGTKRSEVCEADSPERADQECGQDVAGNRLREEGTRGAFSPHP